MYLEQAIRDFSSHILAERGLSPQTEYAYRHDLRQLGEFVGWPQLESITPEDLRSWLAEQHREGLSTLSLNRRAACLRTFFAYWTRKGAMPANPAADLSLPKKARRLPTVLTYDEMVRFFATPCKPYRQNGTSGIRLDLRDRLAFDLLILLGLRRGEVLSLRVDDVDLGGRVLYVRNGKGGKDRALPIPKLLADRLFEYMFSLLPMTSPYLVVSRTGGRLWPHALNTAFHRHLRHCGILRQGVTIHTLRHTMATFLVRQGVSQPTLQRILGHSDPASTSIYIHLEVDDLREGLARHPLLSPPGGGKLRGD